MTGSTWIRTGHAEIDSLYPAIRRFLEQDVLDLVIDGQCLRGYRTPDTRSVWIRDHSDMMRGFRHFERDLTSAVQHFADTQARSGRIFDYFTTFPEKPPSERENWTKYVRVPVEADVEYRFVKAAWLAWQATGDDAWIRAMMPAMERALTYIMSHPWYWDDGAGMVKRAYTIDTWDFAYTSGRHDWLQFQITDDTFWGVMHGDVSGYYEAFRMLASLYRRFGEAGPAHHWESRAAQLADALNARCWNGRFYRHFTKLTPVTIEGVDEDEQLSLSNPMDINRGAVPHERAVSIIEEYRRRRGLGHAFAEWFSIDPPFPDGIFGDERLVRGAYCNGGIMPLVGGELARAAFEHGFETYGVDILRRYSRMIAASGKTYLWYFPDGTPSSAETSTSPEASPTDGWGSSAMLWALVEGLAGVVDRGRTFDRVRLSPRWLAADVHEADVSVGYECSNRSVRYEYRATTGSIAMEVTAEHAAIDFHVLLPEGALPISVTRDGTAVPFSFVKVENSGYAEFACSVNGLARFEIGL
ncbi:MAG: hypothetical protein ACM3NQ_00580 [Bacteroidales bacterium]